jgi:hypothetical protein
MLTDYRKKGNADKEKENLKTLAGNGAMPEIKMNRPRTSRQSTSESKL